MNDAPPAPKPASDAPGSPLRSLLGLVAGWFALYVLGTLFLGVLASMLPHDVPTGEDAVPTERGLALWLAGMVPNGIVAGMITARIAGWSPLGHAAVLGGIIGFFGMVSSDEAHGMPGWFALGRAIVPTLAILAGGAIARALDAKRGRSRG